MTLSASPMDGEYCGGGRCGRGSPLTLGILTAMSMATVVSAMIVSQGELSWFQKEWKPICHGAR
ncbi:MAG: hypothetical protein LBV45_01335 [Xanthomonadaceae bacterium]|nr:hypothetical protein [Xanthomonadaceae bacterium]